MFDVLKLSLVCRMKNSGGWHALHAIAEVELHQTCVAIATERVILGWPGNFIGGKCVAMVTKLCISAMACNAI